MEIESERYEQALVISLDGSLDAMTADKVQLDILTRLDAGYSQIILDLRRVDFMSSSGVRLILETLKKSRGLGGDLCLAGAQPGVHRTLELSGLLRVLKSTPTVDEALLGLESPSP